MISNKYVEITISELYNSFLYYIGDLYYQNLKFYLKKKKKKIASQISKEFIND